MNELHPGLSLTASMVISAMLAVVVLAAYVHKDHTMIACGFDPDVEVSPRFFGEQDEEPTCQDQRGLARDRCYDARFAEMLRPLGSLHLPHHGRELGLR